MPAELVFLHVFNIVAIVAGVGIFMRGIATITRTRAERKSLPATLRARLPADDERLTRLEQTTEAIALQLERVAEGQRFVTKLLSEKNVKPNE